MHKINIDNNLIRTDLLYELKSNKKDYKKSHYDGVKVITQKEDNYDYTTIFFDDITDYESYNKVENVFITELKKYISINKKDVVVIIGLGNSKSTPDSLGPNTIDKLLPTRYLFELGDVEDGFSNVSIYKPDVIGNTGIESKTIIKSIIKEIKPTKVIIIDSLKANNRERLTKTIQITNSGINPGSGINNSRGEISKRTVNCEVIAIGIPTVVDMSNNNEDSFIVTPTNIDFVIEKLSSLLANSLNKSLHKNYNRQINSN